MFPPSRTVGLTEEIVETLYLLGEQHLIVGIPVMSRARRRLAAKSPG
jgi:hypothetical protein